MNICEHVLTEYVIGVGLGCYMSSESVVDDMTCFGKLLAQTADLTRNRSYREIMSQILQKHILINH